MQVIENWKTRADGKVLQITNPLMLSGKRTALRQNETGLILNNAHDVQGECPYTYTEMVRDDDPRAVPAYSGSATYNKGDLVYSASNFVGAAKYKIFMSEFDDNTGNYPAYGYGWTEYWPDYILPGPEPGWHEYDPEIDGEPV